MEPLPSPVNVLVEGDPDEAIACRILEHVGLTFGTAYGKQGKAYLLARVPNYNKAARFAPWLVVVDLDQDADCAPLFVEDKLPNPASGMSFRVAVRAVEAWLMADAERLAAFLDIPLKRVPRNPDAELDPKGLLVRLAAQSRNRAIVQDMVPRQGSGGRVGPGYAGRLIEFVTTTDHFWRPEVAAQRSDSLRRCLEALATLKGWRQDQGLGDWDFPNLSRLKG